jgi:hypothetical protein
LDCGRRTGLVPGGRLVGLARLAGVRRRFM